jgi:hypothetical protein
MEKLKVHILRRLYDHTYIGNKYIPIEELKWGLPSHARNMKAIHKAVKELVRNGCLILHKKGNTVSINPVMLKKVKKSIQ